MEPKISKKNAIEKIQLFVSKSGIEDPVIRLKYNALYPYLYSLAVLEQPEKRNQRFEANRALIDSLLANSKKCFRHHEFLKNLCSQWLEVFGALPPSLKAWLCAYLRGEKPEPQKKRGKNTQYNLRMNVALAAFTVIDMGFPAGKRGGSQNKEQIDNAFDIVADAFNQAGYRITYETVKGYYYDMQHLK